MPTVTETNKTPIDKMKSIVKTLEDMSTEKGFEGLSAEDKQKAMKAYEDLRATENTQKKSVEPQHTDNLVITPEVLKSLLEHYATENSEDKDLQENVSKAVDDINTNDDIRKSLEMEQKQIEMASKEFEGVANSRAMAEDRAEFKSFLQARIDPKGGYLLRPTLVSDFQKEIKERSYIAQLASTVTLGKTATEYMYRVRGERYSHAKLVGETEERPTTPTNEYGLEKIFLHEAYTEPEITNILLMDAEVDVVGEIKDMIVEDFALLQNELYMNGTGQANNQPMGILESDKVLELAGGVDNTKLVDDIIRLVNLIHPTYRRNGVFLMSPNMELNLLLLKNGINNYVVDQNVQTMNFRKLLGYTYYVDDYLDPYTDATNTPVVDNIPMLFGDFNKGYKILRKDTMQMIREQITHKGWTRFYTTRRFGGDCYYRNAVAKLIVA